MTATTEHEIVVSDQNFDQDREIAVRRFGRLNAGIATAKTGLELYRELRVVLVVVQKPSMEGKNLLAMMTRIRHAYDIPLDQ